MGCHENGQPRLDAEPIMIWDTKKEMSRKYTLKVINGKELSLRYSIACFLIKIAGSIAQFDIDIVASSANNYLQRDQTRAE